MRLKLQSMQKILMTAILQAFRRSRATFSALPGNGLTAELNGDKLMGGSQKFMQSQTGISGDLQKQAEQLFSRISKLDKQWHHTIFQELQSDMNVRRYWTDESRNVISLPYLVFIFLKIFIYYP